MNDVPATLAEAMATEPLWLSVWLVVLGGTHLIAIFFTVYKGEQGWGFRWEPLAILGCFALAGLIMNAMYAHYGYVRLLGLGHLIGWAPIYGWMVYKRSSIGFATVWGKYVHWYLLIAGISLVIDAADVIRYLVGDDGSLYLRWGSQD
jgi:hypothetical protein